MAFNVSNYVKDADKPYTNRIADSIISSTTYGLPASAVSIATSAADLLLNSGLASALAAEVIASRTDDAISGGADEFYVLSGKDPTRSARVSLQSLRRKNNPSTNDFLNNINPQTKIAAYKGDNTVEIITVL